MESISFWIKLYYIVIKSINHWQLFLNSASKNVKMYWKVKDFLLLMKQLLHLFIVAMTKLINKFS